MVCVKRERTGFVDTHSRQVLATSIFFCRGLCNGAIMTKIKHTQGATVQSAGTVTINVLHFTVPPQVCFIFVIIGRLQSPKKLLELSSRMLPVIAGMCFH